jgi:Ni/Co efflux regulator RcnB
MFMKKILLGGAIAVSMVAAMAAPAFAANPLNAQRTAARQAVVVPQRQEARQEMRQEERIEMRQEERKEERVETRQATQCGRGGNYDYNHQDVCGPV